MMARSSSHRKLSSTVRSNMADKHSVDICSMFDPCLVKIYELLSKQQQLARKNKVDLKVSLLIFHESISTSICVGIVQYCTLSKHARRSVLV